MRLPLAPERNQWASQRRRASSDGGRALQQLAAVMPTHFIVFPAEVFGGVRFAVSGARCLDLPVSVGSAELGRLWRFVAVGGWERLRPGAQVGCSGFLGSWVGRGSAAGRVAGLGRTDTALLRGCKDQTVAAHARAHL